MNDRPSNRTEFNSRIIFKKNDAHEIQRQKHIQTKKQNGEEKHKTRKTILTIIRITKTKQNSLGENEQKRRRSE